MKTLFQLQYEFGSSDADTEQGTNQGAKLLMDEVDDAEVREILADTQGLDTKEWLHWLRDNQERHPVMMVLPMTTLTPESTHYRFEGLHPHIVFIQRPLHTIEKLNEVLYAVNECIETGTYLVCHTMTARLKRTQTEQRYPWGVRTVVVGTQYLWHRVCPKLRITRSLYFAVTKGKDRTFNRVEILGRLYRAGYEVLEEEFRYGEYFVTARKAKEPVHDTEPTGSPIIHLLRRGKDGKPIVVHKFRTMYTYSEYIQPYMYRYQKLQKGGKFKDDYRVNFWGHLLRRVWLDELPMVWNMLRGELKLVGVRPLSEQYFSLYTPEMQRLRTRVKPGLLPPFYYDRHTPDTIEEIQASERRYLEAYMKAPHKTDLKYFWGIVANILLHRKRSK